MEIFAYGLFYFVIILPEILINLALLGCIVLAVKKRNIFFIFPLILYVGFWAYARIEAQKQYIAEAQKIAAIQLNPLPAVIPDTIIIVNSDGPVLFAIRDLGIFKTAVTYNEGDHPINILSASLIEKTMGNSLTPYFLSDLPDEAIVLKIYGASQLTDRYPNKSDGSPYELLYKKGDKETTIGLYVKPSVEIPLFPPIYKVGENRWFFERNSPTTDDNAKVIANFVSKTINKEKP